MRQLARPRRRRNCARHGATAAAVLRRPATVATVLAITVTLLLGSTPAGADEAVSQWRFSGIERVVAIGDVHGAYPALVEVLQEAGLISAEG